METKQPSVIVQGLRWLRAHWIAFLACSLAILVPCFWHDHIYATDLGSHLYNAWLTQSVERGLLPGLHIEPKYTNVLIDALLGRLLPIVGVVGAERMLVGFCALVFFWGGFSLASVASEKAAWAIAPLLAMMSYGAIFHWGFFNFYLSAGFSLFGLAIVVGGNAKDHLLLPILLILCTLAHPMGTACLVALGAYLVALRWLPTKFHITLTLELLLVAFAVRWYLVRHFEVLPREISEYWLLGADQLIVFDRKYIWLAVAAFGLCAVAIVIGVRKQPISKWLQFYLAVALVVCFAPGGLNSPTTFGMMGYLPDRGSLYSAVALLVLVACCRPPRWFPLATAILAVVFFAGVFRDERLLEQRQQKVNTLLRAKNVTARVIGIIPPIPEWRIHEDHSVDRGCAVVRCYAYDNYEASTGQFRLLAEPDNRFVLVDDAALDAIKDGEWTVSERDLPLSEIYACGTGPADLCVAPLKAGQKNGEVPGLADLP